ncbi:hypothetical protein P186_0152 [Pyrobaculum ferrireducens]|uniref:Uncharacterized protein n=1 Tax=Pyrobaculum ferrireducens TaxID=1104324 RepID=G7VEI9_9CREN|nr:hypothetical protein P186_0152 [Pyrobaculum ferrireducens]
MGVAVPVASPLFDVLEEARVDVFFMESLARRWAGGWVLDSSVGLLATVERDASCLLEEVRVYFSAPSCRGYAQVGSAGASLYLVPIDISPCPLVYVVCGGRGRVLAPTYVFEGGVFRPGSLLVEVGAAAPRWRRHLWPPSAAAGWRPARLLWGGAAVRPGGAESVIRGVSGYPVLYAGAVGALYGVAGGHILLEFKAPGGGAHIGERFAVYRRVGEYLLMEAPWGVDFVLNFVLGVVDGGWVLMGRDGLYVGVFHRREDGERFGYVEVVGPYQDDVRKVEGPTDLIPHVFCTQEVARATGCKPGEVQMYEDSDNYFEVRQGDLQTLCWPACTY